MDVIKILFEIRYFALLLIRIGRKLTMQDFSDLLKCRDIIIKVLDHHDEDVKELMKEVKGVRDLHPKG